MKGIKQRCRASIPHAASFFSAVFCCFSTSLVAQVLPQLDLPALNADLELESGDALLLKGSVSKAGSHDLILGFSSFHGGQWSLEGDEQETPLAEGTIPDTEGHGWIGLPVLRQIRLDLEAGAYALHLSIDQAAPSEVEGQSSVLLHSAEILPSINTEVSLVVGGSASGYADGAASQALFSESITGLDMFQDGTVFLADAGNHRLRQITAEGLVTTLAGDGQTSSVDGQGSQASFGEMISLSSNGSDSLYVLERGSDSNTDRVLRKVDLEGNVVTLGSVRLTVLGQTYGRNRLVSRVGEPWLISDINTRFRGVTRISRIESMEDDLHEVPVISLVHESFFTPSLSDAVLGPDGALWYLTSMVSGLSEGGPVFDLRRLDARLLGAPVVNGKIKLAMIQRRVQGLAMNDAQEIGLLVGDMMAGGLAQSVLLVKDNFEHSPQEGFRSTGRLSELAMGKNRSFVLVEGDRVVQSEGPRNNRLLMGSFQSTPFMPEWRIGLDAMGDDEIRLKIEADINQPVLVQQSSDLMDWQDMGVFEADADGILLIPRDVHQATQFFRFMLNPEQD